MLRRIIDQQMADTLGITGPSTSNAFLTEPQDTEIEAEKDEALFMVWGSGWSSRSFHLIKFLDVGSDFHDLRPWPFSEPLFLHKNWSILEPRDCLDVFQAQVPRGGSGCYPVTRVPVRCPKCCQYLQIFEISQLRR